MLVIILLINAIGCDVATTTNIQYSASLHSVEKYNYWYFHNATKRTKLVSCHIKITVSHSLNACIWHAYAHKNMYLWMMASTEEAREKNLSAFGTISHESECIAECIVAERIWPSCK